MRYKNVWLLFGRDIASENFKKCTRISDDRGEDGRREARKSKEQINYNSILTKVTLVLFIQLT